MSMAKERRAMERRVEAFTDALTGLPNRRALFEAADALSQDRDLKGEAISVLIFDLDHFKQTNDRFGHELGDRVLKLFAITAQAQCDGTGLVARLGGEEFAAILPGADPLEAVGTGEAVGAPSPSPARSSTAWRSAPRSASVRPPISAWLAISAPCSAAPTPRFTRPSRPAAIASSSWGLTMPVR
jgi:GGDEF domain-containing protein